MALQHMGRPPGASARRSALDSRGRRRRWPLGLSLSAVLLVLGGAGWLVARSAAERAVRRAVRARGGSVAFVSLSLRWPPGVTLEEATLELPGLRLEGATLSASAAPWGSLRRRTPCELRLQVRARSASVDPRRLLETLRQTRDTARRAPPASCRRLLAARLVLEEAHLQGQAQAGGLGSLSVRDLRADWDAVERRLGLEVGEVDAEAGLRSSDASLRLAWPPGAPGPTLELARLGSVRLRLVPLLTALRRRLRRWTGGSGPKKETRDEPTRAPDAPSIGTLAAFVTLAGPVEVERLLIEDEAGRRLEGSAELRPEPGRLLTRIRAAEGPAGSRYELRARIPWPLPSLDDVPDGASLQLGFEHLPGAVLTAALPEVPWHAPEGTTLDGSLQLEGGTPPRWKAALVVRDAALAHRRLAPQPVRLPVLRLQGHGTLEPDARRLVLKEGTLAVGDVAVTVDGALARSDAGLELQGRATLPPTPCETAMASLPEALRSPTLDGFAWTGTLSGAVQVEVDPARLDESRLRVAVRDRCEFTQVPAWARAERLRRPFTYRAVGADGTERTRRTGPGTEQWVPLAQVSPFLLHAILAAEDAAFFRHHGFAPWAIEEAFRRNLAAGRFVQGASTLTMQLARNLFLHREKTLARKAQEVVLTWWLERALTKAEILERYVNVVEFGPDVYGIGPAARYYFGRASNELSTAESVFLASLLPAPRRYHRSFEQGRLTGAMARRVRRLLEHMAERGRIDERALQEGLAELQAGLRFRGPEETVAPPRPAPLGRAAPLPIATGAAAGSAEEGPWPLDLPELRDAEPGEDAQPAAPGVNPGW